VNYVNLSLKFVTVYLPKCYTFVLPVSPVLAYETIKRRAGRQLLQCR